jgi:hypothetical protein
MNKHRKVLISIEGKNIDSSVLDTNDISVQRGGSYELLDTALAAGEKLAAKAGIETVSLGASKAVFVATIENAADALKVLSSIVERDDKKMFSNFVTSIPFTNDTDFGLAEKKSVAVSGWRQLQRPTVGIPTLNAPNSDDKFKVCEFDRVRPMVKKDKKGETPIEISQFVYDRRSRGIELRSGTSTVKDIYSRIFIAAGAAPIKGDIYCSYTDDLNQLAIPDGPQKAQIDFRMHNKIAILYADGNKFGSTSADEAEISSTRLTQWDKHVRGLRAKLLATVLDRAQSNPLMGYERDEEGKVKQQLLRLETLEWGGDELMWVVPAFMGFELARLFIEETKTWQYTAETDTKTPSKPRELNHGLGLVFCHHKAPIARVRKLAKKLGELAKPKKGEADETRLVWSALESFDHLGLDLDTGLEARFNSKLKAKDWTMTSAEVLLLNKMLSGAQKGLLPRTQIIGAAVRCVHDEWSDADKVLAHAYRECFKNPEPWSVEFNEQFVKLSGKAMPDLRTLKARDLSMQERRAWILLAEAFDYLGHVA